MAFRGISRTATGAIALALLLVGGPARAFHDGGVGACDGCHTMHGSRAGELPTTPGAYLLQGSDPSSVCLSCHGDDVNRGYTVLTTNVLPGYSPLNFGPAGDFAWLRKSFAWMDRKGTVYSSTGERHGHNVVASDYGLARDPNRTTAPGGLYPSADLSCVSCHDPHGRYRAASDGSIATSGGVIASSGSYGAQPAQGAPVGTYRLLAGTGYAPRSAPLAPAFANAPPAVVAPLTYNRSERTAQIRVAYGAGMSEWCANCHGALHTPLSSQPSAFTHPSGATAKLSQARIADMYNTYVKTGDLSGSAFTSYLSLVPFEEGSTDTLTLSMHARSDGSAPMGPSTGSENVMCLSCHRAHASGWDDMLRWNQKSDALVIDGQWPGTDSVGGASGTIYAQGRTAAETRAAMYDRDPSAFATFQTSLCNKCHAK